MSAMTTSSVEMRVRVQITFNKTQHADAIRLLAGVNRKNLSGFIIDLIQKDAASRVLASDQPPIINVTAPQVANDSGNLADRPAVPLASDGVKRLNLSASMLSVPKKNLGKP
jgi:hypothetical protein